MTTCTAQNKHPVFSPLHLKWRSFTAIAGLVAAIVSFAGGRLWAQPFAEDTIKLFSSPVLSYITVASITITGNRKTRPEVILRELDFAEGDTIALAGLAARLELNEFNLLNMGLFNRVRIRFEAWEGASNQVVLNVVVLESFFIVPYPILELADRNFNVWWETYNRSLRRLNMGVRFTHINLTGRKDPLRAVAQLGFTKKFELIYTLPFFNRHRTLGANINWLHTREKEIGYSTFEDVLQYHRGDNILLRRFRLGLGLRLRPHFNSYHSLDITWHRNEVHPSVLNDYNPDFFTSGSVQRYPAITYGFAFDKRDIRPYPLNGFFFETTAKAEGLGLSSDINALHVSALFMQYFSIDKRWSVEVGMKGKTELLRNKLPYYNSVALGYLHDYIRGYEFYVIDGTDYAWLKTSLRFNLLDRHFNLSRYIRHESLKVLPLKLYLSLHNELAWVNNPWYGEHNPMANVLLWGLSLGFDVVYYYNTAFSLELSRNHRNEYGFFLHWLLAF